MSDKIDKLIKVIREKWVPEFQLQYATNAPWTPFTKKITESKVTLISTAGVYVKGETPFTDHYGLGDPSYREIPLETPLSQLDHFHEHYDHTNAYKDINCIFPIERLKELVDQKFIKSLTPNHYSFMGYVPIPHPLTTRTTPDLVKKLVMQGTDLAILVPT
ncbi:glycine/sarcosine/betaine reductase selenoprotein B family protein [Bacillus pinisoli]|uniref:glycine/sarcosine/betaine reductase selenoprotein B family protein n=1 Tax=Bacillus pinisoli TaxID=2901866 RepID=UPI001FF475FA|nr:glycine/sarcosine/betaine reductase selenoprotein B family protein [Bacillus pinisoli]